MAIFFIFFCPELYNKTPPVIEPSITQPPLTYPATSALSKQPHIIPKPALEPTIGNTHPQILFLLAFLYLKYKSGVSAKAMRNPLSNYQKNLTIKFKNYSDLNTSIVNQRIKMKAKTSLKCPTKRYTPEYQLFKSFRNTALFAFNQRSVYP